MPLVCYRCRAHGRRLFPSARADVIRLQFLLDLLEAVLELAPVVHNSSTLGLLSEELGHLFHFLLALLDAVDADIANARDVGAHGGRGTALAVLDGDALLGLDAELFAGVEVDGRVGLGAGRVERGGGRVDVLGREEVGQVGLLDGSNDTALGRGADNGHGVALLLELVELLGYAGALDGLLAELLGDGAQLALDKVLKLRVGHLEVVLLLEPLEHATEVVADKVLEELVRRVAVVDIVLLEHLVGELGAGLEGEALGLHERVVAVEEDVADLRESSNISAGLRG
jgi:hypothetical protein